MLPYFTITTRLNFTSAYAPSFPALYLGTKTNPQLFNHHDPDLGSHTQTHPPKKYIKVEDDQVEMTLSFGPFRQKRAVFSHEDRLAY